MMLALYNSILHVRSLCPPVLLAIPLRIWSCNQVHPICPTKF